MKPWFLLLAALSIVVMACATAPRHRYSFPSKGGAQRALPRVAETARDAGAPH
jgi:hypothetical protein